MQLEGISVLFSFIGGLGMFLYGMHVMANGLQHFAGGKMQRLMGFLTQNRLMAILVGTLVTAVIQSSSATTVMVVGFVNAGMLNLSQAVGVIMGANIGTTITAWLVSLSEFGSFLNPEFYAPLLLGIGAFVILFAKSDKKKQIGEILIGFAVLFIGAGGFIGTLLGTLIFPILGSLIGGMMGAFVTAFAYELLHTGLSKNAWELAWAAAKMRFMAIIGKLVAGIALAALLVKQVVFL